MCQNYKEVAVNLIICRTKKHHDFQKRIDSWIRKQAFKYFTVEARIVLYWDLRIWTFLWPYNCVCIYVNPFVTLCNPTECYGFQQISVTSFLVALCAECFKHSINHLWRFLKHWLILFSLWVWSTWRIALKYCHLEKKRTSTFMYRLG